MEKQFLFVDAANATWLVYVSLLVLAVYFRFSRLLTVRNLDLLLLLLLSTASVVAGSSRIGALLGRQSAATSTDSAANGEPAASEDGGSAVVPLAATTAEPAVAELPAAQDAAAGNPATPSAVDMSTEVVATSEDAADVSLVPPQPSLPLTESPTGLPDNTAPQKDLTAQANVAAPAEIALPTDAATQNSADPAGGDVPVSAAVEAGPTEAGESEDGRRMSQGTISPRFLNTLYRWGSISLLGLSVLLMIRLVFDEALTRRPRLEQNLNDTGLAFLCVPAFVILAVSVFLTEPPDHALKAMEHGRAMLERKNIDIEVVEGGVQPPAPTEALLGATAAKMAELSENLQGRAKPSPARENVVENATARILVVLAHSIVVLGLLYIGRRHFSSAPLGVAMSCLYLLLPCTAFHVHQLSHVLPGACLTWAIACYRKPVIAGVLLGLACGTLFFAVFLLPIWAVFYGRRGALRFGLSLLGVAAVLAIGLMMTSSDADSFVSKLVTTTNWTVYRLLDDSSAVPNSPFGHLYFRIPMAALFFVMLTAMTFLPRPRNLENLLANSTALVVAAQLWYPDDVGTYVLWYLPMLLLVVFRPRLDRFTPPNPGERAAALASSPAQSAAPSAAAVSRISLYR